AGAKLLLLDEPLGALDAKIRVELRYEIRRLAKDLGLTAIHVTHDQAEAMAISDRIAVMRKGKILQVGTPQELYMNPQHIFVAHFIGEANFLVGYVSEVLSKESVVELRGGLSLRTLDDAHKKGEKIVLAMRPEVLAVDKKKKKAPNSLFGEIERVAFEGTQVRYHVKLENEDRILVIRPTLIAEQLNIGETITIIFPVEKIFVFPYPEGGLIEELALE
ncbi:MAG TPA: ABC transporter ATP-binding protein, partial [Candidatus Bathyarchaeia archaeon]|nr:ABC transporter ATP-binding protein [Candidatus Bathyarchaeia archaeon]